MSADLISEEALKGGNSKPSQEKKFSTQFSHSCSLSQNTSINCDRGEATCKLFPVV